MSKTKVAILGSGNIGTDLMVKILERSEVLELAMLVGIDAESDGLARARARGVKTTHEGIEGLMAERWIAGAGSDTGTDEGSGGRIELTASFVADAGAGRPGNIAKSVVLRGLPH